MNPAHYPNLQMYQNINLNSETFASAHSVGDFFFFFLNSVKKKVDCSLLNLKSKTKPFAN